MIKGNKKLG